MTSIDARSYGTNAADQNQQLDLSQLHSRQAKDAAQAAYEEQKRRLAEQERLAAQKRN